jgi:hypothetical protein
VSAVDPSTRRRVYASCNGECWFCGRALEYGGPPVEDWRQAATVEHLRPRHLGGSNTLANLVLACGACNNWKGGFTLATFRKRVAELAGDETVQFYGERHGLPRQVSTREFFEERGPMVRLRRRKLPPAVAAPVFRIEGGMGELLRRSGSGS